VIDEREAARPTVPERRLTAGSGPAAVIPTMFGVSKLIRHAWCFVLQLAESYLTRSLFRQILGRVERLVWHPT